MLIERMLIRTLGIKSHVVKTVTQDGNGLAVSLDVRKRRRLPCSACGYLGRVRDGLAMRTWKHVPLWGIPVTLCCAPARVACAHCGKTRVEAIPVRLIGLIHQARPIKKTIRSGLCSTPGNRLGNARLRTGFARSCFP